MERTVSASALERRPVACRETDLAALRTIAQVTVNVELFTIPLYMATMYSIQGMHQITGKDDDFYKGRLWPGPATTAHPATDNQRAFNLIFSVFIEEMLHLQMAANIASAIGVKPTFTSPALQNKEHGWICYGPDKTVIPHIVDLRYMEGYKNVKVDIRALDDPNQVKLFQAIEQPEHRAKENLGTNLDSHYRISVPFPDWKPGDELPMFGTIGQMYQCYFDYMNLRYEADETKDKRLWDYAYTYYGQKDLFNVEASKHPEREFPGFDTTVTDAAMSAKAFERAVAMMDAITDQGEGSELKKDEVAVRAVEEKYQASEDALKADYPSYTDIGKPTDSADATARYCNSGSDHYERFLELEGLLRLGKVVTWPQWRSKQERPWRKEDFCTKQYDPKNPYHLPSPEIVANAMNELGCSEDMYRMISKAAVGSIAGITTVLNDYWDLGKKVLFPYPSMVGSGDRMAICWALFRKAPDLSQGTGQENGDSGKLLHACQGLDFKTPGNDCAAVEVFHSCRGSNACKAQGGCGFVQNASGGANCGFGLVAAKTDDGEPQADDPILYSAPNDNKCGTYGGCAVPISDSQVFPRSGIMQLFDFKGERNNSIPFGEMPFERGEKVYDVAWRAYLEVLNHRKQDPPPKPSPNDLRLAFPPST